MPAWFRGSAASSERDAAQVSVRPYARFAASVFLHRVQAKKYQRTWIFAVVPAVFMIENVTVKEEHCANDPAAKLNHARSLRV